MKTLRNIREGDVNSYKILTIIRVDIEIELKTELFCYIIHLIEILVDNM